MDPEVDIEAFKVDRSDFKKTSSKALMSGFATITFMTRKSTNEEVVQQQFDKRMLDLFFDNAVKLHSLCHHKGIIKFIGWCTDKKRGYLYFKKANKGSLCGMIRRCQEGDRDPLFDDTHKLIIAYGIASAMKYLHSMDILHRDLKSTNILLNDRLYPFISDFSTAIWKYDTFTENEIQQTTAKIMAPEFLDNYEKYSRTKPIDVYSYGMVLYFLMTEKDPYNDENPLKIIERVMKNERPDFPSNDTPNEKWQRLIRSCWDQDPQCRPTFAQICDLLESPEFVTSDIDSTLFESYKEKVNKSGNSSQKAEPTIPEVSYIDQIKKDAEEGNADAQNSYALCLYNGFNVQQDREKVRHYFEQSANNGNHEAQFYFALILAREGDIQRSTNYFQQSADALVPDAISNHAQRLILENKIDESIQYLQYSIQRGSISAMIAYGNICELNSNYGYADTFYDMASSCCHCLDEVGFFFPIDYKVYHCENCNLDICEGCAKSCHKTHQVVELGSDHSFVCGCGKNGFKDRKGKNHCSIEFVGEMLCDDQPVCCQHFYRCLNCSNSNNEFICHDCMKGCHQNHRIVDCGIQRGFCSCIKICKRKDKNCKSIYFVNTAPDECSEKISKYPVVQRWFKCMTCGQYNSDDHAGICKQCAEKCHKGHILLDCGVKRNRCQCVETKHCQLKK